MSFKDLFNEESTTYKVGSIEVNWYPNEDTKCAGMFWINIFPKDGNGFEHITSKIRIGDLDKEFTIAKTDRVCQGVLATLYTTISNHSIREFFGDE